MANLEKVANIASSANNLALQIEKISKAYLVQIGRFGAHFGIPVPAHAIHQFGLGLEELRELAER